MAHDTPGKDDPTLVRLGIPGLDGILDGGLTPNRVYLVEGTPGSGKTTLALQFLIEGRARGRKGLYVTLSETREELILLLGPAGVGKSSLAIQYARTAALRGDRAALFTFDESLETMLQRSEGLGIPIDGLLPDGLLRVQPVDSG